GRAVDGPGVGLDGLARALDHDVGDLILRAADRRDADDDARLLCRGIVRRRRRPLAADRAPHLVGHLLVGRVERQDKIVVLAEAGVVEDARRLRGALLAALDRVVVAVAREGLDALAPRRHADGHHGLDRGLPGSRTHEHEPGYSEQHAQRSPGSYSFVHAITRRPNYVDSAQRANIAVRAI